MLRYLVSGLVIVSPPQPYRLSGSPMLRYTSISSSYIYRTELGWQGVLMYEFNLLNLLPLRTYLQTNICIFHTLFSQAGDGHALAVLFKIDFPCCSGLSSVDLANKRVIKILI